MTPTAVATGPSQAQERVLLTASGITRLLDRMERDGHISREEAVALMRASADEEDAIEKLPVTPGPIVPAREQLGYLLLEQKKPEKARKEFDTALANSPGRRGARARLPLDVPQPEDADRRAVKPARALGRIDRRRGILLALTVLSIPTALLAVAPAGRRCRCRGGADRRPCRPH